MMFLSFGDCLGMHCLFSCNIESPKAKMLKSDSRTINKFSVGSDSYSTYSGDIASI